MRKAVGGYKPVRKVRQVSCWSPVEIPHPHNPPAYSCSSTSPWALSRYNPVICMSRHNSGRANGHSGRTKLLLYFYNILKEDKLIGTFNKLQVPGEKQPQGRGSAIFTFNIDNSTFCKSQANSNGNRER